MYKNFGPYHFLKKYKNNKYIVYKYINSQEIYFI